MDWTIDSTIKLIKAIETYPLLWDSSHIDNRSRKKRRKAIQELALLLNCDSHEVMRKWRTILAQYRREKKKIADSISSGTEISDVPIWFGYKHLKFLYGRGTHSQDETDELNQDTKEHTDNEKPETPEKKVEYFKTPLHSLKRHAVDEGPRIERTFSLVDNLNKQIEMSQQDDDDLFAASVAMKLRKITEERTKILVQRDIDNLLYDAIIGVSKYSPMSLLDSDSRR